MADGHTITAAAQAPAQRVFPEVQAFGWHNATTDRYGQRTYWTGLYLDREQRRWIGNADGLIEDGGAVTIDHHGKTYRVTLVDFEDHEVVLHHGLEPGHERTRTTLFAFLADNAFGPEERVEICQRVKGGVYVGGGGAQPEWFLHNAAVPESRFGGADGGKLFKDAA